MSDTAFYFGCWDGPGHFLHVPGGRTREHSLPPDFPLRFHILDGGLLPPNLPEVEGRATFIHINGWTVMSFWDRSVDTRGKCNSAFLFRGRLSFSEACHEAAEAFPSVWRRFKFPIVEFRTEPTQ
jgi:hypothetical protein